MRKKKQNQGRINIIGVETLISHATPSPYLFAADCHWTMEIGFPQRLCELSLPYS